MEGLHRDVELRHHEARRDRDRQFKIRSPGKYHLCLPPTADFLLRSEVVDEYVHARTPLDPIRVAPPPHALPRGHLNEKNDPHPRYLRQPRSLQVAVMVR